MENTTTNELEELEYPEDERLFKIAYWSKAVSWVIVIVGVLQRGLSFYSTYIDVSPYQIQDWTWSSSIFLSIFSGLISIAFYFFVLQAVGEILYLVIDIKKKLQTEEA
jgi:hypothetical protein